jgi:hypothetical protein
MSSSAGTGILSTAMNASAHSPSSVNLSSTESDYVLRIFRGLQRAESYAFYLVPERLLRVTGYRELQAYVWNTFGVGREMHAIAAATEAAGEAAREAAVEAAAQPDTGMHFADLLQGAIKFSGFFSYLTSRWSLACFTVVRTPMIWLTRAEVLNF